MKLIANALLALLIASLLFGLAGCASPLAPDLNPFGPPQTTPVAPEVWVPEWVRVTEEADRLDQRTPAYPPLGVYMVPPATDEPYDGFWCGRPFKCWGLYYEGKVYVVEGLGSYTATVMRHEMLHHILNGDGDHCSYLWAMLDLANGTTCGSVSRGDHDPDKEA